MASILVALASLWIITVVTWSLNKRNVLPVKFCAICVGVSSTWIWLLAGILFGVLPLASYMPVVAILMGGSVVGIAYQSEKYLKGGRSPLLWKALFIPVGFGTVWSVVYFAFGFAILGILVLLAVVGSFLEFPFMKENKTRTADLEERMKDCC